MLTLISAVSFFLAGVVVGVVLSAMLDVYFRTHPGPKRRRK